MRICVFQSSYEGSDSILQKFDNVSSQPGLFTSQHQFEYRWIHKEKAEQEIDEAVAEGFDFYYNLLWGTPDDAVAGAAASRYFESLGLPSCGSRSLERYQNKNDFFTRARLYGAPPVPGTERFPLFVKPANGCASQLIDENSVCNNEEELRSALRRVNEALYEPRMRRAAAMGIEDAAEYARSYDPVGRDSDDIVVQEYIGGRDYGCVVVQMGTGCVALTPYVYRMKPTSGKEEFLTFDLKWDDDTHVELLQKRHDAALFERIQQVAIEAYLVSSCRDNNTGCDVDLRVTPDGQVFVIEVNCQPAQFVPRDGDQDLPIMHSFPGGHAAAINVFIANHMLRHPDQWNRYSEIAIQYDKMAPRYDEMTASMSTMAETLSKLVDRFDFSGTTMDLACGTGAFGRALAQSRKSPGPSSLPDGCRLLGCDISPGMLDVCRKTGLYHSLHLGSMESVLLELSPTTIDHVICSSAMTFLRPEMFSFFLALLFIVVDKSITLTIEEMTDAYNDSLAKAGLGGMHSYNHVAGMEAFGEPKGWRLVSRERVFSWVSPSTGDEIYTNYFRYERVEGDTRDLMFRSAELPDRGRLEGACALRNTI